MSATSGSLVCPQCGAATSVSVGRCVHCGFLFTKATPPVNARVGSIASRMRPRAKPGNAGRVAAAVLASGLVAVVAISALAWSTLQRHVERRRTAASARPTPSARAAPAPSSPALEPSVLIAKAKSLALGWHDDALLVDIEAAPVQGDGKIDGAGTLRFRFGKPAGRSVGNGAPVLPAQFQVVFDGTGSQTSEQALTQARAVAEPNCLVEDVVKVVRSASPEAGALRLRYALSEQLGRPVWRAYAASGSELLFTLDGVSCNILAEK